MKPFATLFFLACCLINIATAQVGLGIDQATPVSKLDVNGNLTVGTAYSGMTAAPANGAIIQGNVGIGVAAPTQKLDVEGAIEIGDAATPTTGAIRWNPATKDFEGYDGARWNSLTGAHERTLIYTGDGF